MPLFGETYTVACSASVCNSALTLVQLQAGAVPLDITRVYCSQGNVNSAAMQPLWLLKKTTGAAVNSNAPVPHDSTGKASSVTGANSGTGVFGGSTAEGTDSNVVRRASFNIQVGVEVLFTDAERVRVSSGEIYALKLPVTPVVSGCAWDAGITYEEAR